MSASQDIARPEQAKQPRIGLLGGSFDPVHSAHIKLAMAALDQLALDHVELLPAADPWQRQALGANAQQRLTMLELATADQAGLQVNPMELERGGKTYTIDTVSQLPRAAQYVWILGTDQLQNFCTWHRWRDILEHVTLAVAQRPGSATQPPQALSQALDERGSLLLHIEFTPLDVSATAIRQRIATGQPTDKCLPAAVARYIEQHQLYLTFSA